MVYACFSPTGRGARGHSLYICVVRLTDIKLIANVREAELELFFDSNRRLTEKNVTKGTLVTKEEFEAWLAAQETSSPPP